MWRDVEEDSIIEGGLTCCHQLKDTGLCRLSQPVCCPALHFSDLFPVLGEPELLLPQVQTGAPLSGHLLQPGGGVEGPPVGGGRGVTPGEAGDRVTEAPLRHRHHHGLGGDTLRLVWNRSQSGSSHRQLSYSHLTRRIWGLLTVSPSMLEAVQVRDPLISFWTFWRTRAVLLTRIPAVRFWVTLEFWRKQYIDILFSCGSSISVCSRLYSVKNSSSDLSDASRGELNDFKTVAGVRYLNQLFKRYLITAGIMVIQLTGLWTEMLTLRFHSTL